jgi:FtsH-binding integral membrane protein
MIARPTTVVLALWLLMALMLVSIASNAAHFSPWEFLIPNPDPVSWIMPALLVGPLFLLALTRRMSARPAARVAWGLATLLVGLIAAIALSFHPSAYLGNLYV